MADLRIPEEYEAGLTKLVALSDEAVWELVEALKEEPPVLNGSNMSARVASKLETVPRKDVDDIVGILGSLYLLRSRYGSSIDDFTNDVLQAMDESDTEELKLSGKNRDHFRSRLSELLDLKSVGVGTKALEVLFENERSFHSARIVTDLRPIFGADPEEPPAGAVVVHMLKITYFERGRLRDFFVALDTTDVGTLRGILDRASLKDNNLKAFLDSAQMPYVDPE